MQWGYDSATLGGVVELKKLLFEAKLPNRAHSDDACFDLYSAQHWDISPEETVAITTGYNIALPKGYAGLVCSRSGLASRNGVFVLNAPGIVDAGYRGELKVILHNTSEDLFTVRVGDRIGQLFIQKVLPFVCVEVDQFSDEQTDRGEGGFGSTGA